MTEAGEIESADPRAVDPAFLRAREIRIAVQRFGLGPKPGILTRLGTGPTPGRAAILGEIANPQNALLVNGRLPTYRTACRAGETGFHPAWAISKLELRAKLQKQLRPEIGFAERMVMFWANHFSMSVDKADICRATIGQVERDVIRPNVFGSFRAMLVGVMRHPAMIRYLDNQDSIGPNSPIGQSWGAGYNENLAREILELHTLGVGGGYAQSDVIALAKALTGWSYVRGWESDHGYNGGTQANRGQFLFRADWHEPGPRRILGKLYAGTGADQALAVLNALAVHPRTAEHIAFKLVRHFIADEPTPEMVAPVAEAFTRSGGNLAETARALIDLPAAWSPTFRRLRTPYEVAIAQYRALQVPLYDPDADWAFLEPLRALNHQPSSRITPDGYPDESYYWLNPDAMRVREDTAFFFVSYTRDDYKGPDAVALADSLFGPALSAKARETIAAAADQQRALSLLLMTPEFQRR